MWVVSLQGEKDYLNMISEHLKEISVSIYLDQSKFYLRFQEMNIFMKFEEVERLIKEHIDTINGAVKLALGSCEHIKTDEIYFQYEDGSRYTSSSISIHINIYDDRIRETKMELLVPISRWIQLSSKNQKVKVVFKLMVNDTTSWSGLYKIYEVIIKDEKIDSYSSIRKEKLNLFSRTANNYNAIGMNARHALNYEPPKNKMSIYEARNLINLLIIDWIRLKESL